MVGVPEERGHQPEAIRAAAECQEHGQVQRSVGAADMLHDAYGTHRALGGREW